MGRADVPTAEGGPGGPGGLHAWGFSGDIPRAPAPPRNHQFLQQNEKGKNQREVTGGTEQLVPYLIKASFQKKSCSENQRLTGPVRSAEQLHWCWGQHPARASGSPGSEARLHTFPNESEIPWLTHDTHGNLFGC